MGDQKGVDNPMSEAREWAERSRNARPSLALIGEANRNEPTLRARVLENGSCEVTVTEANGIGRVLVIPHDQASFLGVFLVRTFSEAPVLLHGRPHDAKMTEDHA